ncbi:hypothetical protein [Amycolatopsis azurea]|uniref:Uncharacterized protein n=1 Tax=Amycolatopsis azurea DSM 43854 TaxID=1238180 RepID=M2QC57_9PSEU|nr:hypothetical protein [Amycolatopsis azurea]EMD29625.1 hypothetical protein C791_2984 [Amycolatopsis azurea DSM 43854]OOC07557.1 hypothetical protein B0293_07770 [Amycolatopsis azurea DSM 43854]
MAVVAQERKPRVVRTSIPPHLAHRQASDEEQAGWTKEQLKVYSCMHCNTAYKPGSGAAWICEHWHEGL